jgi:hypothetical protein
MWVHVTSHPYMSRNPKMRARARGENNMITELQIRFPKIFESEFEQQLENYCKIRDAFTKNFSQEELRKILSEEEIIIH